MYSPSHMIAHWHIVATQFLPAKIKRIFTNMVYFTDNYHNPVNERILSLHNAYSIPSPPYLENLYPRDTPLDDPAYSSVYIYNEEILHLIDGNTHCLFET